jgi:hypothetical protein
VSRGLRPCLDVGMWFSILDLAFLLRWTLVLSYGLSLCLFVELSFDAVTCFSASHPLLRWALMLPCVLWLCVGKKLGLHVFKTRLCVIEVSEKTYGHVTTVRFNSVILI